ncbi:putative Enoyl-CoA hydratase/3-hydroxybutyryl-CoA epimerase / 3-hydroxyacyl-CoA dehydrogenase [Desulfarculales bacterium]
MQEVVYSLDQATGLATFILDNAGPANAIGERFIAELNAATIRARQDKVNGVILVSTKSKSFLNGASLAEIIDNHSLLNIKHLILKLQETLGTLATSPFPVVALLKDQIALGGGFELLLWVCDQVFATPGSHIGLPEINVGLFPAAGGPETLKRVVGFKQALDIVMGGKVLPAEFFARYPLVTIVKVDNGLELARQWLIDHASQINRNYDPAWVEPEALDVQACGALLDEARARYVLCPQKPYFHAALEAFAVSLELPLEQAARQHAEIFASLIVDLNVRNKIDLFFTITSLGPKLARIDKKAALPVHELAIIGAGLMGQGIAQVCANAGIKVLLIDVDKAAAQVAKDKIQTKLTPLINKGHWRPQRIRVVMDNIRTTIDYQELAKVPLVIEAVFEDLDLKRRILAQVQEVNPNIIFASNTSTLPLAEIAEKALRPEQVVGMHYFSPVPLMPLLEVIEGPWTSPEALATAVTSGRRQGKTCIVVGDGPGFYTSRTFGVYVMTGFLLAEMGLDPWEVDRLALEAGFPQGPLHVYGTAGGGVIYHAGKAMQSRKPDLPLAQSVINMYEGGYAGAGTPCFYKERLEPDRSAQQFLARDGSLPTPSREEAKEMLLLSMVNQAFQCLDEGVLRDYPSMDIGAVLGIGFPDCWHGPARYVSQKGIRATAKRLWAIYEKFGLAYYKPALEFERLFACGVDRGLI